MVKLVRHVVPHKGACAQLHDVGGVDDEEQAVVVEAECGFVEFEGKLQFALLLDDGGFVLCGGILRVLLRGC